MEVEKSEGVTKILKYNPQSVMPAQKGFEHT